jgi:hypothetical protein
VLPVVAELCLLDREPLFVILGALLVPGAVEELLGGSWRHAMSLRFQSVIT